MNAIDYRTKFEKGAVKHEPCAKCAHATFAQAYCLQGFCSEYHSIVYLEAGRTCPAWVAKQEAAA